MSKSSRGGRQFIICTSNYTNSIGLDSLPSPIFNVGDTTHQWNRCISISFEYSLGLGTPANRELVHTVSEWERCREITANAKNCPVSVETVENGWWDCNLNIRIYVWPWAYPQTNPVFGELVEFQVLYGNGCSRISALESYTMSSKSQWMGLAHELLEFILWRLQNRMHELGVRMPPRENL